MNDWLSRLLAQLERGGGTVRVTVARVRGSAPREVGATMLVSETGCEGTIGGGHLEWKAQEIARSMLVRQKTRVRLDRFTLGASLGQCCGGAVELWFERFDAASRPSVAMVLERRRGDPELLLVSSLDNDEGARLIPRREALNLGWLQEDWRLPRLIVTDGTPRLIEPVLMPLQPLWVFGAGHVGRSLINVLSELPFQITWIDSREDMFPTCLPPNVAACVEEVPARRVGNANAATMFVIMTHSHDLDYEICRAVLARDDFLWAGLIGSRSKATRFKQRLRQHGTCGANLDRLACPIGIPGIRSKLPAAVALAVAAQIVECQERARVPDMEDKFVESRQQVVA